jgi:hypothetical protein
MLQASSRLQPPFAVPAPRSRGRDALQVRDGTYLSPPASRATHTLIPTHIHMYIYFPLQDSTITRNNIAAVCRISIGWVAREELVLPSTTWGRAR